MLININNVYMIFYKCVRIFSLSLNKLILHLLIAIILFFIKIFVDNNNKYKIKSQK